MRRPSVRVIDDVSADELGFRFLSGRPSLDLTATVGERWRRNFERLGTVEDLDRWITGSGLVEVPVAGSPADLMVARALREAVYSAAVSVIGAKAIASRDSRVINDAAAAAPPAPLLVAGTRTRWVAETKAPAALSAVARDAIDLFTGPLRIRIRECAAESCALLFVDSSRPGQRRWCSSDTCGGQARARTYRTRHRVATSSRPAAD